MKITFSWDEEKARANLRRHKVSFEEAATVFHNLPFQVFHDPDHSGNEDRYIAAGFSARSRLLLVVHCENRTGTEIRIISARRATRAERRTLFGGDAR